MTHEEYMNEALALAREAAESDRMRADQTAGELLAELESIEQELKKKTSAQAG